MVEIIAVNWLDDSSMKSLFTRQMTFTVQALLSSKMVSITGVLELKKSEIPVFH